MYCSPSHHKYSKKGTCFSQHELDEIRKEINEIEKKDIISKRAPKKQIDMYFKNVCKDNEYCWLEHLSYQTRRKLEIAFRPKKPNSWYSNPRTWLSNYDIDKVMAQYELLYTDFKFLGVHPLDFATKENGYCIGKNMCTFDIRNLGKKKQFALVINLDYHNESGSHWVAIYCSLYPRKPNFGIYFYDSTGNPPLKEIEKFMSIIKENVIRDFKPSTASKFHVEYNRTQHQFKNTECGMFCMVFLTQCLKNIEFNDIGNRMKNDDDINKIRDIFMNSALEYIPIYNSKNSFKKLCELFGINLLSLIFKDENSSFFEKIIE